MSHRVVTTGNARSLTRAQRILHEALETHAPELDPAQIRAIERACLEGLYDEGFVITKQVTA